MEMSSAELVVDHRQGLKEEVSAAGGPYSSPVLFYCIVPIVSMTTFWQSHDRAGLTFVAIARKQSSADGVPASFSTFYQTASLIGPWCEKWRT